MRLLQFGADSLSMASLLPAGVKGGPGFVHVGGSSPWVSVSPLNWDVACSFKVYIKSESLYTSDVVGEEAVLIVLARRQAKSGLFMWNGLLRIWRGGV